MALWGSLVSPLSLHAQEPAIVPKTAPTLSASAPLPSPQSATYQWVLTGPFYRSEFVTCYTRDCSGIRIGYTEVRIPFYSYVLTQVEEERRTTIPEPSLPVPGHEAPFVGNPGPGSVR